MSTNQKPGLAFRIVDGIVRFTASDAFAVVILTLMLVLTFVGTLEQVDHGLYEVQKKYFDSAFLVHDLFGKIPILLPGVYLLMILLFINLVSGAIIRAPKNWRYPGNMIGHIGILILLFGGFVAHHFSINGKQRTSPMNRSDTQSQDDVQAALTFVAPQDEKPYFHSSALTGGDPKIFFETEDRRDGPAWGAVIPVD